MKKIRDMEFYDLIELLANIVNTNRVFSMKHYVIRVTTTKCWYYN